MRVLPSCFAALLAIAIFLAPGRAEAEDKGIFGAGLIIGEPTGLSVKYYLGDDIAVEDLIVFGDG